MLVRIYRYYNPSKLEFIFINEQYPTYTRRMQLQAARKHNRQIVCVIITHLLNFRRVRRCLI